MLFADLLSLLLITFFKCFYSCSCHIFSSWCTEVCHLLRSSKSPLTGFLCSIG